MFSTDTTAPRRTLHELRELIAAADDAEPSDELEAVEWKRGLDLDDMENVVKIAVWIIGVANRSPSHARGSFDGLAYLMLGVGGANLGMAKAWDEDRLRPKLDRYVESAGPRWSFHNVCMSDGRTVLVVIAEAPREGDKIHSLQKEFTGPKSNYRAGQIFVRSGTRTRPATPTDLDMLQARLLSGGNKATTDLTLTVNHHHVLYLDTSDEAIREFVKLQGAQMPEPVKPKTIQPGSAYGLGLDSTNSFRERVSEYLRVLGGRIRQFTLEQASVTRRLDLSLVVENMSETAAADVRLSLECPPELEMFNVGSAITLPKMPQQEKHWDMHASHLDHMHDIVPGNPDLSISRDPSALHVVLELGTIHPFQRREVRLPVLICEVPTEVETFQLAWSLTAIDRRGRASGLAFVHRSVERYAIAQLISLDGKRKSELDEAKSAQS